MPVNFTVSTKATDTHITASLHGDAVENAAFYVLKNGVRVHQQWYSPSLDLAFPHDGSKGVYRVIAFSRDAAGEVSSVTTPEVFVFEAAADLSSLSLKGVEAGPMTIRSRDHTFHCLYSPHEESRLFVMLTAAVNRGRHVVPAFNRWRWRDKLPGHVLCISDPTLLAHDDLSIGWYLGSEQKDATEDMAALVRAYAAQLGIPLHQVITYGSSAGGFAALALAARLNSNATAVAINPQTNALKYDRRRVAEMLRACFPDREEAEVADLYAERVCMATALSRKAARVILAQNTLDNEHWEPHYLPFAAALGLPSSSGESPCGTHTAIVYQDERGHASEPDAVFAQIIREICESNCGASR